MLFRDRGGRRILAVSHVGTIRALRFLPERWSYEEAVTRLHDVIPNCAATTYRNDARTNRLVLSDLCAVHWNSNTRTEP